MHITFTSIPLAKASLLSLQLPTQPPAKGSAPSVGGTAHSQGANGLPCLVQRHFPVPLASTCIALHLKLENTVIPAALCWRGVGSWEVQWEAAPPLIWEAGLDLGCWVAPERSLSLSEPQVPPLKHALNDISFKHVLMIK